MKEDKKENLDTIAIKDLLLRCIIGVNDVERHEKQDVLVNIVIWSDLSEAAVTDDLEKTVNYRQVTKEIISLVENSRFFLIETLAEKIAQTCLKHERIHKVKITVEKPGALRFARSVGVEIVRRKD